MSKPIPPPKVWSDAATATLWRRMWSAVMLTTEAEVCRSILAGRPVIARQLDAVALRRALRGGSLPAPSAYIEITVEMLDAVAEGGEFS